MHVTCVGRYYAEDVAYTMTQLQLDEKGRYNGESSISLHSLLVSLFSDEWACFLERNCVETHDQRCGNLPEAELTRWASDRGQLLSRTVRGVMRYGDGLRVLAALEGTPADQVEALVNLKFSEVVTAQIYGKHRKSTKPDEVQRADDIDSLRRQFSANLRVAFVEEEAAADGSSRFASVLLGVDTVTKKDVVCYKVKLPGNPIIGEGKPENQNHALIFCHGECLQTLDMNQDAYLGETYKMRNLLMLFRGNVRLVGHPEHIFSHSGGAVAYFSAANEFVFGTTVQRFLTWPLMVRFHYGHPDVWDKLWCVGNGGVAKASRTLHVSEDIFGGFNVVLRGGTIDYAEFIHCGKGRDMGFIAVNGFESKISAGGAITSVSRDMSRLCRSFDIFRIHSFYFSMAGFYMTTLQSMWSVYTFALAQLVFAIMQVIGGRHTRHSPPCTWHALLPYAALYCCALSSVLTLCSSSRTPSSRTRRRPPMKWPTSTRRRGPSRSMRRRPFSRSPSRRSLAAAVLWWIQVCCPLMTKHDSVE